MRINQLAPRLKRQETEEGEGDYWADEKTRQVHLSDAGHEHAEELIAEAGLLQPGESLYDAANIRLMHHLNAALRAHALYHRDVEYIVRNGEVIIVDEFTGRTMPGRRWSDGLHQAVEAKEGVRVREENQTVASITFQNYFRMYSKLAGMTGTADTEAFEFQSIYGLEVVVIPTHRPMVRKDHSDFVYLDGRRTSSTRSSRTFDDCVTRGQPALVGTTSIETSEFLSGLLEKEKIAHQVLNAKQHEREAHHRRAGRSARHGDDRHQHGRPRHGHRARRQSRSRAASDRSGRRGRARSARARNGSKRHDAVIAAGGLHIVGTERHESRRIDNQLRGRSGRQGDPGSSRFYLSLEDNLMRIFGDPERTKRWLQTAGMKEGEVIESRMLSKQIERAQRKVEAHNFDARKNLLEYDDVANDQRKVIYQQRTELMAAEDVADAVAGIRHEVVNTIIDRFVPPKSPEEMWDIEGLSAGDRARLRRAHRRQELARSRQESWPRTACARSIVEELDRAYEAKVQTYGAPVVRHIEKAIMLQQLDSHWREHLAAMDYLRQGIHLRSYAQKNPKQEYKREAFELFTAMLDRIKHDTVSMLSRMQLRTQAEIDAEEEERQRRLARAMQFQHAAPEQITAPPAPGSGRGAAAGRAPSRSRSSCARRRRSAATSRVPCGSGKKYKHCHGALAAREG